MAKESHRSSDHAHSPTAAALRCAVVGSGPAGIYACEALLAHADAAHPHGHDPDIRIDLIERLPVPYGLLRFGVAPDHPRIKGIAQVLERIVGDERIRFLGGVEFGRDLLLADTERFYHAIIVATGALADRPLRVPGADLAGVHGAAEFVTWYDGHPDAAQDWDVSAAHVAVVGAGNVALDVARMLLRRPADLESTDIPAAVRAVLRGNSAQVVTILARRGPADVKFTPKELAEMGRLPGVQVVVDPADLSLDPAATQRLTGNRRARTMVRTLRSWADATAQAFPHAAPAELADAAETAALAAGHKVLRFRFYCAPQAFLGRNEHVTAVRVARTFLVDGSLRTSPETTDIEAASAYTAIGYRSAPLPGLPFDHTAAVLPHAHGRVLDALTDAPLPGLYTAGWIKRGPSGVIGTNRACAAETVDALWADAVAGALPDPEQPEPDAVLALLAERSVQVVTARGWAAIDAHERALGEAAGRTRTKVRERAELLRIAAGR